MTRGTHGRESQEKVVAAYIFILTHSLLPNIMLIRSTCESPVPLHGTLMHQSVILPIVMLPRATVLSLLLSLCRVVSRLGILYRTLATSCCIWPCYKAFALLRHVGDAAPTKAESCYLMSYYVNLHHITLYHEVAYITRAGARVWSVMLSSCITAKGVVAVQDG